MRKGLASVVAAVFCAVAWAAGSAQAAESTFASLKVDGLAWSTDEVIAGVRIEIRGARIASVRRVFGGGGEISCDASACRYELEPPSGNNFIGAYRGFWPDKAWQAALLQDWLELIRTGSDGAASLQSLEIDGELTFVTSPFSGPTRSAKLATSDFVLRGGNPRDGRCLLNGCLHGLN